MASPNYRQCYEILELKSDVDWAQVSAAHHRLVKIWHPDRYKGNDPESAQEVFIEFNKAYNHLKNYYKQHKSLPTFNSGQNIEFQTPGRQNYNNVPASNFKNAPLENAPLEMVPTRIRNGFNFINLQIAMLIAVAIFVLLVLKGLDDRRKAQLIDKGREINSSLGGVSRAPNKSSISQ